MKQKENDYEGISSNDDYMIENWRSDGYGNCCDTCPCYKKTEWIDRCMVTFMATDEFMPCVVYRIARAIKRSTHVLIE